MLSNDTQVIKRAFNEEGGKDAIFVCFLFFLFADLMLIANKTAHRVVIGANQQTPLGLQRIVALKGVSHQDFTLGLQEILPMGID